MFETGRMVPGAGIEPARPFSGKRRILSPLRLPISPSGQKDGFLSQVQGENHQKNLLEVTSHVRVKNRGRYQRSKTLRSLHISYTINRVEFSPFYLQITPFPDSSSIFPQYTPTSPAGQALLSELLASVWR